MNRNKVKPDPSSCSWSPQTLNAFDTGTNRIKPAVMTGFGYDTAGNLTSDPNTPVNGIVYDAENHQTSYTKAGVGTTSYSYDGDGHRVKKTDPSNNTTIFVYNVGGQPKDFINAPENITTYQTEFRAYMVGSAVAQGSGRESYNAQGIDYWNSGWRAADRETKRQAGVNRVIERLYNAIPRAPGPRLMEFKK